MAKLNCWEFKNCERQTGGEKAEELGYVLQQPMKGLAAFTAEKMQEGHAGFLRALCAEERFRGLLRRSIITAKIAIFFRP